MPADDRQARTRHVRPYEGLLADQSAAIGVGALFLVLGILGAIKTIGGSSAAMLFGTFQVSLWLNLIHLALGIAGLAMARSFAMARWYLLGGGAVCLGLWLYGRLVGSNVLALNNADDWLHFGLGVAMVILGLTLAGTRVPRGARGERLLP